MSLAAHRAQLLAELRDRFVGYIKAGLSAKSIAQREGFEEDYVKKLRKRIAGEEGLTLVDGVSDPQPFGFTKGGNRFRARLGDFIHDLLNRRGRHGLELARDLGITQTQQKQAAESPYHHNWTLSQLERSATLEGLTFTEFMLSRMKPTAFSPKEEIEAWNRAIKAAIIG